MFLGCKYALNLQYVYFIKITSSFYKEEFLGKVIFF
jgi:hypothetical protein